MGGAGLMLFLRWLVAWVGSYKSWVLLGPNQAYNLISLKLQAKNGPLDALNRAA